MTRLRVLVTGGCGFLGAYVARDLISHGHDVTVADIGGSGLLHEIVGGDLGPEAVPPVIRLDVSDATGLLRLAQEWQVTAIVHLAALLSPECQRAPMQGVLANLAGTASVFETAMALGISRVVWASATAVLGQGSRTGTGRRFDPQNFYAMYKAASEMQAQRYHADFGVPSAGIRIAMGYGYGRTGGRSPWISRLIGNPALGQPAVVTGGDVQVPWVYIEDASAAVVRALEAGLSGCRVYTCAGDPRWKHEVADFVISVLPGSQISIVGPDEHYPMDLDDGALRTGLGWDPAYRMEDGVLATINRIRGAAGLPPVRTP
jgi:UDP-glucose 4-epimerase